MIAWMHCNRENYSWNFENHGGDVGRPREFCFTPLRVLNRQKFYMDQSRKLSLGSNEYMIYYRP